MRVGKSHYTKSMGVKHKLQILLLIQVLILIVWYGSNLLFQLHVFSVQEAMRETLIVNQIHKNTLDKIEEAQQVSAYPVLRGSKETAKELYRYLAANSADKKIGSVMVKEFEKEAAEIFNLNKQVSRVVIVTLAGEGLVLDRNTLGGTATGIQIDTGQPWVQETLKLKGAAADAILLDDNQINYRDSNRYIYCARAIVYAEQYRITGFSIIAIDRNRLASLFLSQLEENNQKIALINSNCELLYGELDSEIAGRLVLSNEEQTFKISMDGEQYRVVYYYPKEGGIGVVLMTPIKTFFRYLTVSTWTFYFLLMLMIAIVIWISSNIMQSINRPLQKLLKCVDEYSRGNLAYKADETEQGEFTVLAKEMNHMASSILNYIDEIYIRDIEKKENELKILRSQVNPHFLYNTLETARMKAYCNEDFEVEEMLMKLSLILRYVLVKSAETVTLEQELDNIKAYLDICNMSARFPIRLETCFEPICKKAIMPRLTLQPLVENSIKHGCLKEGMDGCITILGYMDQDGCHLKISDNGKGVGKEKIEKLNCMISSKKEPKETGSSSVIGLYNVHRRIQLMLGEQYGIELDSQPEQGFSIHMLVPLSETEGE